MKCLETRKQGCLTVRTRLTDAGRRVKTMELPWSLWLRVKPSVMKGVPGFEKTELARERIARVKTLLAAGNKSEYIADVEGLTGQRVRQIKARMKK